MTNWEKFLGTPEKAAKTIQSIRRIGNEHYGFEQAYLDWLADKSEKTAIKDFPSPTGCMAEWLQEEAS